MRDANGITFVYESKKACLKRHYMENNMKNFAQGLHK
jgi:hypothetical protein